MNNLRQETVYTPRDAHSECNIPAPVGSGLVPDRKGVRGGVCNFNAKRQWPHPERRKRHIWKTQEQPLGQIPHPSPSSQGAVIGIFASSDFGKVKSSWFGKEKGIAYFCIFPPYNNTDARIQDFQKIEKVSDVVQS